MLGWMRSNCATHWVLYLNKCVKSYKVTTSNKYCEGVVGCAAYSSTYVRVDCRQVIAPHVPVLGYFASYQFLYIVYRE